MLLAFAHTLISADSRIFGKACESKILEAECEISQRLRI